MKQIQFGVVGSGWRSLYFLRIAKELPEQFAVTGVVVRDKEKGRLFEKEWDVKTYRSASELTRDSPKFVITSVPWRANAPLIREFSLAGIPVLSETPPAADLDELIALINDIGPDAKVQVAEQYPFQPIHAARQAIIGSDLLGAVSQAQVSVAHGYHGVALIRKHLGITFENAIIAARQYRSHIVAGPDRGGPPSSEKLVDTTQTVASLDFGEKLGVFDFTGDQYFSWIRSPRVLVRGERGEINNTTVRYLKDFRTPITAELMRCDAGQDGNLEGAHHKGITLGANWIYRNPFVPGRLSDDEIAVATCMQKMADLVDDGPEFYSLAEASQDHYLSMMIDRAVEIGAAIATTTQPWAI